MELRNKRIMVTGAQGLLAVKLSMNSRPLTMKSSS